MDGRGRIFLLLQVFFCFFVFASTEETKQNCSQVQCPGPLIYYHDMGCTPAYKNEGDCCAYKYNCDHLYVRSPNKCYIQNRSYEIGEFAKREDIIECDRTCVCAPGRKSSHFWCLYNRYDHSPHFDTNCYLKRNILECSSGTLICPKSKSDIPRCVVDGRTYMVGEYFAPLKEPWKLCRCQEGYTGDNIEPFCIKSNLRCNIQFYFNNDIANNNAPFYELYENSATGCSIFWRRQDETDTVIPNPNGPTASEENSSGEEDLTCKYGNLTMNIGDELSRRTGPVSSCVRCVCEVPPTLTCRLIDSRECRGVTLPRFFELFLGLKK